MGVEAQPSQPGIDVGARRGDFTRYARWHVHFGSPLHQRTDEAPDQRGPDDDLAVDLAFVNGDFRIAHVGAPCNTGNDGCTPATTPPPVRRPMARPQRFVRGRQNARPACGTCGTPSPTVPGHHGQVTAHDRQGISLWTRKPAWSCRNRYISFGNDNYRGGAGNQGPPVWGCRPAGPQNLQWCQGTANTVMRTRRRNSPAGSPRPSRVLTRHAAQARRTALPDRATPSRTAGNCEGSMSA